MIIKQPFEVSMKRFREAVEAIDEEELRVKMETGYLLAARNCELVTKVSEKEMLGHRSRNYGIFMDCKIRDFIIQPTEPQGIQLGLKEPFSQKVMVVRVAVAKRGKRVMTKPQPTNEANPLVEATVTPEETEKALVAYKQTEILEKWKKGQITVDPLWIKVLNEELHLRYVALPCSLNYEPWIKDLLQWYQKHPTEGLSIPITRRHFWWLYRKALGSILPSKKLLGKGSVKNPLRHIRINHLIEYYGFIPYEINSYTGWSLTGIFAQLGQAVSGNLEIYAHLSWRTYLPKLCTPITRFIG